MKIFIDEKNYNKLNQCLLIWNFTWKLNFFTNFETGRTNREIFDDIPTEECGGILKLS